MVQPSGHSRGRHGIRLDQRWFAIAAAAVLGALVGFLVGVNHSTLAVRSCKAYAAPTQATATCSDGWAYAIPVDNVRWRDSSGRWHQDGRPDCLPRGPQAVERITFASVEATIDGVGWRPVVWVSC